MVIEREIQELSHVSSGHFPDRSARWLLRQREHLEALLKIIASDLSVYLDFDRVEPLNRSFISDELRTQESDMVFSVPFQGQTETCDELIIYILIEHQSTVDPSMGLRLLSYMAQIWAEQRRQWQEQQVPQGQWRLKPIVPIVFYTGDLEWKTPLSLTAIMDVPEVLSRFVPTFETLLLDVKATDPEALTQTGDPLGWLLTVLQHEKSDESSMRQALLDALAALTDLRAGDATQYTRAILYLFLLILHRRSAEEHQDLLGLLVRENTQNMEVVNMAESIIELSEQRGLEQGIAQGIEQGIEQGARETSIRNILAVLTARFPQHDPQPVQHALEAILDTDQLTQLLQTAALIPTFEAFLQALEA